MNGVRFDEKHSYDDFGLILSGREIALPEPKTVTIDVPGRDGMIDLTEAITGEVKYKNRKLTLTFTALHVISRWGAVVSELANYLHGKRMRIVFDDDALFYWYGRCTINQFKTDRNLATITVNCDVDPYKYEVDSYYDAWKWDTFSFVNGIIRTYNITVDDIKTVTLVNRRMPVTPTFTALAEDMTVEFAGTVYTLPKGRSQIREIRLREGANLLTFRGNGTVQYEYRGGSL